MTRAKRKEIEKMLENNLDLDVGMAIGLMNLEKKKRHNVLNVFRDVCKYYFERHKYVSKQSRLILVKYVN